MLNAHKELIAFVINPISGTRTKKDIPDLIDKFLEKERFKYSVHFTKCKNDATSITEKLIKDGYTKIVAVGGDGTVNEVASALVDTNCALGIIPVGSGNGLARHLGVPLKIEDSIRYLNKTLTAKIDVGVVNDKYFFCTSGIGFDAYVVDIFSQSSRRGLRTYIKTVFRELLRYKSQKYIVNFDNNTLDLDAYLITVGNASQYGNNVMVCPFADIQDGILDITIIKPFPKLMGFNLTYKMFKGNIDKSKYSLTFKTNSLTIKKTGKNIVHADGEVLEVEGDINFKILPKNLNVCVNEKNS